MKATRQLIRIDEELCNGCGNCVTGCAEGALAIIDGKARLVNEVFCDGLGACLGECPTGALRIVEVEVGDFDPAAVTSHLAAQGRSAPDHMPDPASLRLGAGMTNGAPHGCPGSAAMSLNRSASAAPSDAPSCRESNIPREQAGPGVSHWPIQLRLVPPTAPFLREASLLFTADCVPPAFPGFHERFLPGRVLLLGCPKFDDSAAAVAKLTEILRANDIRDITVLRMEVPCCAALEPIAARAVAASGKTVPAHTVVITREGRIQTVGAEGLKQLRL